MTTPANPLAQLQPAKVWEHFYALSRIPRGSGNEAGVRAHLQQFAAQRGLACEVDGAGNLLMRVRPDAKGATVCLQGHMDMVCVADEGVAHDFERDPIPLYLDGDLVKARGTTLGADNGIGVAFGLAMVDEATGPLELLFTVDEEVGLNGATDLKSGWLKARTMLNLDSEEEDSVTIACSGGRDLVLSLPWPVSAQAGLAELQVKVKGLHGGHSGVDIHLGRTNANRVLGRALQLVLDERGALYRADGGVKRNAIAPAATAVVGLPAGRVEAFKKGCERLVKELRGPADPELVIEVTPATADDVPVTREGFERLVALLAELPHGVLKTTPSDPKQPFVSINLAMLMQEPEVLRIVMSARSPAAAEIEAVVEQVRAIGAKHGATLKAENGYPGWEPNYASPLLATTKRIYAEVFGHAPHVLEIHAGLECGIIGNKYPGLDMISLGPDLKYPHSPREQISVGSVGRVWNLTLRLLKELQK